MKWVTVDAMRLIPYKCIACGGTPRDVEGDNVPAYFAEGVDYDWGKALYLCDSCVRIVGQLRGMVDVDVHEKVKKQLEVELEEHEALARAYDAQENRIERMLDGVRAKKEVQSTRSKGKAKAA